MEWGLGGHLVGTWGGVLGWMLGSVLGIFEREGFGDWRLYDYVRKLENSRLSYTTLETGCDCAAPLAGITQLRLRALY